MKNNKKKAQKHTQNIGHVDGKRNIFACICVINAATVNQGRSQS